MGMCLHFCIIFTKKFSDLANSVNKLLNNGLGLI